MKQNNQVQVLNVVGGKNSHGGKGGEMRIREKSNFKANSALDQVEGTNMYRASGEEESQ